MFLPIPFLKKKQDEEYILILILRQEKVAAAIIKKQTGKSILIGKHEEFLSSPLQETSMDSLISVLDKTISRAEETLPPSVSTKKTIFGLPSSWITEKHISKDYLHILKKACDALDITPIGFIELPEAIIHFLQEEEGAPTTAILAEYGNSYLSVTVAKGGRIFQTKQTQLIDEPAKSLETILQTFTDIDNFPSRIIAFDGLKTSSISHSLTTHQWSRNLPFLHMPKVTILPHDFDLNAMIFGAASQLGIDSENLILEVKEAMVNQEYGQKQQINITIENNEESDNSFGFKEDVDIEKSAEQIPYPTAPDKTPEVEDPQEVIPQEIHINPAPTFQINENYKNSQADNLSMPEDEVFSAYKPENKTKLPKINISLTSLIPKFPGKKDSHFLFIGLPVIFIFLGAVLAMYIIMLQATITIDVTPKLVEQKEEIVFAINEPDDFSKNVISAQSTDVELSGTAEANATGKKETGTKAKGVVTIYNSEYSKKTLTEGTSILSSNNYVFTLDKDVSIASATGDIFTSVKSGTAQVSVTAKQIGPEYNLPSNTKFTIGDNQSLAARNEQAFAGGAKKQVTVVSAKDISSLTEELPKSLKSKSKEALESKLSKTETLISVITDFKPSKTDFSSYTDEEARTVTLDSKVNFQGIYYDNLSLVNFVKETVIKNSDPNLNLKDSDIQNTIRNIKQNNDKTISAELLIKAVLLPKIDQTKLTEELSGKTFDQAKQILSRYPQVENIDIKLYPPLPIFPSLLPRKPENIQLIISSND